MPKNQKFRDLLRTWLPKSPQNLKTVTALIKAARVPPSSVTMVITGDRSLQHDVAEKLAAILCDEEDRRRRLVAELLKTGRNVATTGEEPKWRRREKAKRSVAERAKAGEKVNVRFIVSEPFVRAEGEEGFAVELFKHLKELMDLKCDVGPSTILEFKDLEAQLKIGDVDLVVTALLPTFRRQLFMDFSRPFPYLGVPLSGLVSRDLQTRLAKANIQLNAEHLLDPPHELLPEIADARIMLVRGEAGEEFFRAFFDHKLLGLTVLEGPRSLDPTQILGQLRSQSADLFLADVGTCRSVMDQPGAADDYEPLAEATEAMEVIRPLEMGTERTGRGVYPRLAVYRVAFGLPKDDPAWKRMVDDAFESLMSEGIRSLLSLYRRYIRNDRRTNASFIPFLLSDDETIGSGQAKRYFESLPEIRALKRQDKAADEDEAAKNVAKAVLEMLAARETAGGVG